MTGLVLAARPFYAAECLDARGRPPPWTLDTLQDFATRTGDPFGGRALPGVQPAVALQIEASYDRPVWVGLDGRELRAWSRVLEAMWARWGLRPGETVAFFDYGSSPVVLLASGQYVPHLRHGAADRLAVTAVCNDGVASMAPRMADILRMVRPAALIARRDVLAPLAEAVRRAGVDMGRICRWVAVSEPDGAPPAREAARYAERWSAPVYRILRADTACFLAGDCAGCGYFHVDPRRYALEALPGGEVAVTARFARTCPAVRYNLGLGTIRGRGCPSEPDAWRLAWT